MAMFGNKVWPPPGQEPSHKCQGVTRKGRPCERHVAPGEVVCNLHREMPMSREQLLLALALATNTALERMMRLANSKNEKVALDACRDLLDRGGMMRHTGLHVQDHTPDLGDVSPEERIERVRQALALFEARRAARVPSPAILEGEVSDVE